jgi:hypothetical protein
MEAVNIFTVKKLVPLYKGEEEALRIELMQFEEVGYEVVVGKNTYQKGDRVVFIMPDYCLSNIPLFEDFIAPNGDPKKSYLGNINGEPRRIRAKKFSFHKGDGMHVYSNGIVLPLKEVYNYLLTSYKYDLEKTKEEDMAKFMSEALQITKYEEPEILGKTGNARKGGFPEGVYKTDETNINNIWDSIIFPKVLIGTLKVDGSSITIGVTDKYPEGFIASRNINKSFTQTKIVGRRKKNFWDYLMFWKKPDLNVYETGPSDDLFVVHGKKYIGRMLELGYTNLILRGELHGTASKGSGNSRNPHAKLDPNILFFNIDKMENGIARKVDRAEFRSISQFLQLDTVPELFNIAFNSREELEDVCNLTFQNYKHDHKMLIEGIVLNSWDNQFSCKFMNNEYDSKK